LHVLLGLCGGNGSNPFSAGIWVAGSYTDTLLKGFQCINADEALEWNC